MESHIRQLAQAGAKEIILPNLPPLEKTPEGLSKSENQQISLRDGVISYNSKLLNLANDLQTELAINIHYIDAWLSPKPSRSESCHSLESFTKASFASSKLSPS